MRPRKTSLLLLLAGLLVPLAAAPPALGAQQKPPQPAAAQPAQPDAAATGQDPVAILKQAVDQAKAGKMKEAVALLEPLRERKDTPKPILATLGALYLQVGRPADAFAVLEPLAQPEDADPAVLYNAGRAGLALGKVVKAEKFFERSVAKEPGTPASRELGLIRGQESRFRESLALLLPWARSHPDDKEARLAAAFAAIRLKRAPDAESLLSDLPQTDPQVRLAWGNVLLLKNDPAGAIATLKPLLDEPSAKVPDTLLGDTRRLLAEADLQAGKAEDAISVLQDHAVGPASHLTLARAKYQTGDVKGALETLKPFAEPVLKISPQKKDPRWPIAADIVLSYGRWLLADGQAKEALPYLHLATQVHPRDKEAWQSYGQALAATGQRDEAKEALETFQKLAEQAGNQTAQMHDIRERQNDPTGAQIERARQLLAQGKGEEALKILQGEIQLEPKDIRPYLLASRTLLVLGRPEEALQEAQRALELAPDDPDAVYQLGTVKLALKDLDAAEVDLRHALELDPDHVPALNDLAVLLLVKGQRDEARGLLQKVLKLRPDDPQAKANLARLDNRAKSGSP